MDKKEQKLGLSLKVEEELPAHIKIVFDANEKVSRSSDPWAPQHLITWHKTTPVTILITGLAWYADQHRQRYESKLGDDGFLGPAWADMVRSARALLNGELGGLDAGTCDGILVDMLKEEDFTLDG